jgi:hypothetical protein
MKQNEEIDLTKSLIFIFITLLVTLLITSLMIIPNIQKLKVSKIYTMRSLSLSKDLLHYYNSLKSKSKDLQEANRKILEALSKNIQNERVNRFIKNKFDNVEIADKNITIYKEDFKKYSKNIQTHLKSPALLYDFIDSINRYENIAEISFPIYMQKESGGDIKLLFDINLYTLKK